MSSLQLQESLSLLLDSDCVENGTWTFKNIELSFGTDGVITLYVFSSFVFLFNLILFAVTLYKFFRCHALSKQQVFSNV